MARSPRRKSSRLADEEQFDEVLEELWVLAENGEPAELGRVEVEGALPMRLALDRMKSLGLVDLTRACPGTAHAQADSQPLPCCVSSRY